jgi:hypothetical protein
MKKALYYFIIFGISFLKLNGQDLSESDNSFFDDLIKSKIVLEKSKIDSDTLAKVFTGTFYRVNAGFSSVDGVSMCLNYLFVMKDGQLIEFDSRTDSMITLVSLLRNDFIIKSNSDAKVFETVLNKLYPLSWIDEEYKEIIKKDNNWYFIRGKFFDSKSGYFVTLDKNSKITNIGYSMEAIKSDN